MERAPAMHHATHTMHRTTSGYIATDTIPACSVRTNATDTQPAQHTWLRMGGCEVRKAHRNVRRAAHHVTFNVTQRALCCLGKCGRINPLRVLHEYSDVSIDAVCVECQRGAQRSQEYHCRYAAHSQSPAERSASGP